MGRRPIYRSLVEAELRQDPLRSDRAIATQIGCTPTWVGILRRRLHLWTGRRTFVTRAGETRMMRTPQ